MEERRTSVETWGEGGAGGRRDEERKRLLVELNHSILMTFNELDQ